MLINLTNHNHKDKKYPWSESQISEAKRLYGSILDLTFPAINPNWRKEEVTELAKQYLEQCISLNKGEQNLTIHVMGEMTFTHTFILLAKEIGISCVASTTDRLVTHEDKNIKTAIFQFVKFREY